MSVLVDSHCHLDAGEFDPDRAAVIERARAAGVQFQVVPAVTAASWPKLREVCQQAPGLYPAYGLHPMFLAEHRAGHLPLLREWIERERPRAIGECGLDYFVEGLDAEAQQTYFTGQLRLARDFDLPVIVHARRAVDAVIAAIRRIGGLRGVVHSFSGSPEQAAQLHRQGFLLGLGGPLTYERAQRLQRLVREMPLEQLLLETDAPDQPDAAIRGQRNEPARLSIIARHVAALRQTDLETVARTTTDNARRLFALPAA
ncbi:TatD family hydrolase [Stenotrophomonas sp. TWI143]|uniref:DNAase n=1 Tax=Stenotrophomonas maltophilia TaxID=40324 RepID=A0AAP7GST5_STEMA|nr:MULTISPECIES: TatD family hydrolase [Stenotrophomonas]MBH1594356.1 TatD family hydrolase [Stenotrophomonas maltophilia]MBH1666851.1 TatD family hydrolase [Stenotrophomonas maltophilia]MBH1835198.1 TatD family hydrolase [Stenotrophomonas maltophilia]MDH0172564.1 TatD family hydrolase [Stenotrophomonas sp. GD04145]MDH2022374.1 TatD family hydrolase [Stenotrophomonas sp. GD03680]